MAEAARRATGSFAGTGLCGGSPFEGRSSGLPGFALEGSRCTGEAVALRSDEIKVDQIRRL